MQWFSPEQFGTFWSALSASSNIAGSLCPFIAAWVITQFDWRASLILSGNYWSLEPNIKQKIKRIFFQPE